MAVQGSDRQEVGELNIFWVKVNASRETFGNEGGPILLQVLLESFECVTTLLAITRSKDEGQLGREWLFAYELVNELAADAQSQAAGKGKSVR